MIIPEKMFEHQSPDIMVDEQTRLVEIANRYNEIAKASQDIAMLLMSRAVRVPPASYNRARTLTGLPDLRVVNRGREHPSDRPRELGELTGRELDVLGALTLGFSNKEIAAAFFVTEQTIKFHLSNIYKKLGVGNRTQASLAAHQVGLLNWASTVKGEMRGYEVMGVTKSLMAEQQRQASVE